MAQVTIHEAKTNLSKLIARALEGEDVVIARGKEPKVRLVPIENARPRRVPGRWRGRFTVDERFFEPMGEDELAAWGF